VKTETKKASEEATLVPLDRIGFDSKFHKTSTIIRKKKKKTKKEEPPSQEMHLKIPLYSRGLELSISKSGCKVSALHFLVEYIPPTAF
jgi:hypothetical protein